MNSLHKISTTKDRQLDRPNRLEPYCFPEIPRFASQGKGMQASINDIEKRTREIEELAYSRGFQQGERAGMEWGKKKAEPVLNNFQQALLELGKIKEEIYMKAEKETVSLALAIARKIVCKEVSTNKEVILNIIKEALKKVLDHKGIKIRVSPADLQFVKDSKLQLLDSIDAAEGIIFEEDPSIREGGCIIETSLGDIDARIDKQIQMVEEAFKSQLEMPGHV